MTVVHSEGTLRPHSSVMQTPSTIDWIGSAYLDVHDDVGAQEFGEGQSVGIRMTPWFDHLACMLQGAN